jgi:signal transduction histidine kinase
MTAPVVATSFLLLTVGVGAAWYVHQLEKNVSQNILVNASSVRAAEELEIYVREIRTQLDRYLLTQKKEYLDDIPAFHEQTDRWLTEAERWSTTDQERRLTARARQGHDRFYKDLRRIARETPDEGRPQAIRGLIDDVLIREILEPTHEYLDLNEKDVEDSIAQNQVFANRLVYGLLLLGTCGAGAGLVAGFGFARGFSRSLVQLSVPIRDAAGQLDQIVGPITFDASGDLKELESVLRLIADRIGAIIERLRQSEREVLRAEQLAAVGQMAAGMAHELRNPLTSMKILVQAALETEDGGHRTEDNEPESLSSSVLCPLSSEESGRGLSGRDLAVLEEEIRRLERLVQTFLQFARPPRLEKKTLDVRALVRESIDLMSARAAAGGHRIEFVPPPEPALAAVDADQFRQVLLNLFLNSFDAAGLNGVIRVEVETSPSPLPLSPIVGERGRGEGDGWLTLRVTDNGCGLPAELGGRIFAPFVTTKETGLGLGLSICKRIAEAHGGEIGGATRPEGGAVFTWRLPAAERIPPLSRGPEGSAGALPSGPRLNGPREEPCRDCS